ncbi:MAG: hypothetical protein ACYTFT_14625 [Planctomycetota bacterium]|jgi:hypothetical protein
MARPATSRAVADEIARSYEKFDRSHLINILTYLTKTYVVDGTMPFNLPGEGGKLAAVDGAEKEVTFPKLIDQLKKRLPNLKELSFFQVVGDKVTLRAGNQKVTFGDRVTTEFVASADPPPRQTQAPASAIGAAASAGAGASEKKPEKAPSLSATEQETLHDIATRFGNLELD